VENLVNTFLSLSPEAFSVLGFIEIGMKDHDWVSISDVACFSAFPIRRVEYEALILEAAGLVYLKTLHYQGYQIDFNGFDLLALADFAERDIIKSIGERAGVGKVSVVYEALRYTPRVIVKFHRQGRTSFKHVRRSRGLLKNLPRSSWLYAATLAAKREFKIMERLNPKVSLPRPIALTKTMELVNGGLHNQVPIVNPEESLEIILDELKEAFHLSIIHSDLSEFNIIIHDDGIEIIDWLQAVDINHPGVLEKLEWYVSNILGFLERKNKIRKILTVLNYVRTPATEACQ
jgi:RIO kinase 2